MSSQIEQFPLVKVSADGSEWRYFPETRITIFVPSGKVDRMSLESGLKLADELIEYHAQDPVWFFLVDQRKLSGITRHAQNEMTKRLYVMPTHRMNYCATLMTTTLPNRMLGIFLNGLSRLAGPHVVLRSFLNEEEAFRWLVELYETVEI